MNIDSLANLIGAADIATLRTVAVKYLPFIGLDSTFFSDGPYDGGLDFAIRTQRVSGQVIGIQLSVEKKKWARKVEADVQKAQKVHQVSTLYFVTSIRIPEASWAGVHAGIVKSTGVNVLKFDGPAIATEFIRNNAVNELLSHFGLASLAPKIDERLSPQNEAIAALLVFGSDSRDFLSGMIDSVVKAWLAKREGASRDEIIASVLSESGLPSSQGVAINSSIDRLLQSEAIISLKKIISLSDREVKVYKGLRSEAEFEFGSLSANIASHLAGDVFSEGDRSLILDNLLALVRALVASSLQVSSAQTERDEIYHLVHGTIASRVGVVNADIIFSDLATLVSESSYGKRVASVRLYEIVLSMGARTLSEALGGTKRIEIYLDTSVFIPLISGALFDPVMDRFGKSAADILELLNADEFDAILPAQYLEEAAAHLVMACRDYRSLLNDGIDIARSTNAFASHFSSLKRSAKNADLTFDEYVATFGVNIATAGDSLEDAQFYAARDRAYAELRRIAGKYRIRVRDCDKGTSKRALEKAMERYNEAGNSSSKTSLLVRHDAQVVSHLETRVTESDDLLILCTWDRMHSDINAGGYLGYFVMSPPGLIDFLSVGKLSSGGSTISALSSFVDAVGETEVVASARIWDVIAKISGGEMSDGQAIAAARKFRDEYLSGHATAGVTDEASITDSWIAWRKART
ncbi:hypothetical protein [Stenotrophomonas indicatrix]|uniref:Restriction endonuclease n=1 Tax=Stenotrophomonas indicatrix TaxID=2045451 RepID=A0ABT8QH14_9GAMM|nr:hypothetical protein [Stenotrophomonas indicatrix]MDN8663727.1 hypothetical protein [Stenotrophomonas indicatrix]MDN8671213.1 hypothetical protein [Stenotrophomonas indicatrix]